MHLDPFEGDQDHFLRRERAAGWWFGLGFGLKTFLFGRLEKDGGETGERTVSCVCFYRMCFSSSRG